MICPYQAGKLASERTVKHRAKENAEKFQEVSFSVVSVPTLSKSILLPLDAVVKPALMTAL